VDHATLMFEGGTRLSFEGLTEDRRCADPQVTFTLVADEVQKPGTKVRSSVTDVPFLDDPAIGSFASTVVTALQGGAPQFYAQVFAQWIAAHLLLGSSRHVGWHRSVAKECISDARLVRVLDYIESHLSDRLDLRVLSHEACVSPFHFAALFRKAVGVMPHRHVQHLRMQVAPARSARDPPTQRACG
jgi:AraC family transcriptional regulator